jgi:hypothetical protein
MNASGVCESFWPLSEPCFFDAGSCRNGTCVCSGYWDGFNQFIEIDGLDCPYHSTILMILRYFCSYFKIIKWKVDNKYTMKDFINPYLCSHASSLCSEVLLAARYCRKESPSKVLECIKS